MKENKTGIYILTYPGDYHLALPLIKSLEYFNPELPITILAGNGFNINDHPFTGKEIFQPDQKKWELFSEYDKKFSLFDGPYERFLYIDADMLCLRNVSGIFKKMEEDEAQNKHSIYVNLPNEYYGKVNDSVYRDDRENLIKNGQLGNLVNIKLFDGQYADEIYNQYPFNTGLWAANKHIFEYEYLLEYKVKEIEFFKNVLKRPYDCINYDLFYIDQGKLNYLVWKKNLNVQSLYPDANFIWGGIPFPFSLPQVLAGECDVPFIHWAGCPRPSVSLFNKVPFFYFYAKMWGFLGYKPSLFTSVPGKDVWNYFCRENVPAEILKFTLKDSDKITKTYFAAFKRRLLRKSIYK